MKDLLKKQLAKLKDLLRYPSTYKAIIAAISSAALAAFPDSAILIGKIGAGAYAFVSAFWSDADVKAK
jgi:hypothetical protein